MVPLRGATPPWQMGARTRPVSRGQAPWAQPSPSAEHSPAHLGRTGHGNDRKPDAALTPQGHRSFWNRGSPGSLNVRGLSMKVTPQGTQGPCSAPPELGHLSERQKEISACSLRCSFRRRTGSECPECPAFSLPSAGPWGGLERQTCPSGGSLCPAHEHLTLAGQRPGPSSGPQEHLAPFTWRWPFLTDDVSSPEVRRGTERAGHGLPTF